MKIAFEKKVVHGTCKGGEDLFLKVKITSVEEPSPDYVKFILHHGTLTHYLESLPRDEDDARASDEPDEGLWVEGGRLKSTSTEYEFKLNWSLEEVRSRVEKIALEGDWMKRLKTGVYEVTEDLFVDGNAD